MTNSAEKNILFLGGNESPLLEWLKDLGEPVIQTSEKITPEFIHSNSVKLIISYGYRHIIRKNVLELLPSSAINLHISYLPWNRGSDPNLWSILENSPKGVTIHLVDEGVDTGDILFQKRIDLKLNDHTLKSSYDLLQEEILQLFKSRWGEIKSKSFHPHKQIKGGSHHYKKDFNLLKDRLLNDYGWNIPLNILMRNYREMRLKNIKSFIVAELSANHDHNIDIAKKTIMAAKECGADAIKLQTYTADTLTIDSQQDHFMIHGGLWDGRTLYDLYKQAFTPWDWHEELFRYAREEVGIDIFSSPFDPTAVDFLEQFNPSYYKIASFEIFDIPLIEYVARMGRPIIISTGIATLADIELAVETCRAVGNDNITLLKCTSSYPAPIEEANLATIPNMKKTFGLEVGLSDHTMGISAALAAVALGATVIEKHFILDRNVGGPDSSFSMEPEEFTSMVKAIREVEAALGTVSYQLTEKAKQSKVFSRSLFVVKDVKAGDLISAENIRSIRPGYGMHPKYYNQVIGKKFSNDQERGTPLDWTCITE